MKNPELINREDLLAEVEAVYKDRYDRSYDQAVHDMYNAIVKRIRRAPNCAKKTDKYENKCEKRDEKCKYLTDDGLCMGQKCMPVCSPNGPYCPLKRYGND